MTYSRRGRGASTPDRIHQALYAVHGRPEVADGTPSARRSVRRWRPRLSSVPGVPELLDRLAPVWRTRSWPPISTSSSARPAAPPSGGSWRRPGPRSRGAARRSTRPGPVLKHEIPIRTFTEWTDARPGFLEVDLVAHCGTSTEGFYLCTLCAVDIATAWVELEAVWGKGQKRVGGAVHHVRTRLPMPLVGLDSDNGSEFINRSLLEYCRGYGITFTRSRALEEERQRSCRAEERRRRPPAHRL